MLLCPSIRPTSTLIRGEKEKENREVDRKNTESNLQMGRTEKREATIKMERRSAKTGTSTGSTASSEGSKRRERQEVEERAMDQRPVVRRRTGASDNAGEQTAMRGGELDEEGRAGWEEGKKYQGADSENVMSFIYDLAVTGSDWP